jgi:hypothetical protein
MYSRTGVRQKMLNSKRVSCTCTRPCTHACMRLRLHVVRECGPVSCMCVCMHAPVRVHVRTRVCVGCVYSCIRARTHAQEITWGRSAKATLGITNAKPPAVAIVFRSAERLSVSIASSRRMVHAAAPCLLANPPASRARGSLPALPVLCVHAGGRGCGGDGSDRACVRFHCWHALALVHAYGVTCACVCRRCHDPSPGSCREARSPRQLCFAHLKAETAPSPHTRSARRLEYIARSDLICRGAVYEHRPKKSKKGR